jgi:hypothetical protein
VLPSNALATQTQGLLQQQPREPQGPQVLQLVERHLRTVISRGRRTVIIMSWPLSTILPPPPPPPHHHQQQQQALEQVAVAYRVADGIVIITIIMGCTANLNLNLNYNFDSISSYFSIASPINYLRLHRQFAQCLYGLLITSWMFVAASASSIPRQVRAHRNRKRLQHYNTLNSIDTCTSSGKSKSNGNGKSNNKRVVVKSSSSSSSSSSTSCVAAPLSSTNIITPCVPHAEVVQHVCTHKQVMVPSLSRSSSSSSLRHSSSTIPNSTSATTTTVPSSSPPPPPPVTERSTNQPPASLAPSESCQVFVGQDFSVLIGGQSKFDMAAALQEHEPHVGSRSKRQQLVDQAYAAQVKALCEVHHHLHGTAAIGRRSTVDSVSGVSGGGGGGIVALNTLADQIESVKACEALKHMRKEKQKVVDLQMRQHGTSSLPNVPLAVDPNTMEQQQQQQSDQQQQRQVFHSTLVAKVPAQQIRLCAGAQQIRDEPNAGGNSLHSEILSFELLQRIFGVQLLHTEMVCLCRPCCECALLANRSECHASMTECLYMRVGN